MAQLIQSPWASGLSSIAEAFAAAPGNRARVRQMELDAANMEADNALAKLKYDREVAQQNTDNQHWAADHNLALGKDRREAAVQPYTIKNLQGEIDAHSLANDFAKANNPLLLREKQNAVGLEDARISSLDDTSNSMADAVMAGVEKKMPAFDLGPMLRSGSALPPPNSLPGVIDTGMETGGYGSTAGMDDIQHRLNLRDQIGDLADGAVLSNKDLNSAQWIKDQTAAFGGGAGYRPATAEEKAMYGVKPDAPMMMDADNKPSILSDGKQTINVGGNAPETQIAVAMKDRYDIARASSAALDALDNAQAALPGAITGAAANQRLALQKVAAYMGLADPKALASITNTETFRAAMQPVVAAALHATVGSSQISDADREFAAKAAAGEITLDATSINRLINITRAANTTIVRDYNQTLGDVYPDDGTHTRERGLYRVEQAPQFSATPYGPELPPPPQPENNPVATIPQAAIDRLKANHSPKAVADFEEVFGPGSASKALRGGN